MNKPEQNYTVGETADSRSSIWLWALLAVSAGLLLFIFWDSLVRMVGSWSTAEYSHGYLIPVVALFLLWQRVNALPAATQRGSWWGVALLAVGLAMFFLGELSAIFTIIQYGFLVSLLGITIAFFGLGTARILWVVFVYLVFMIPLPNFLYFNLSSQLQLISSQIGVAVIRLFDISVFLEGNVIDLGRMQLQVAEACSGMRYLFPLMSFGFLIAYLYIGPFWQRAIIFLTTVPITIFMNSFRIGVIGITVDRWGQEMAEGFLHDFEGWVVFMGCLGILFLEITAFHLLSGDKRRALDRVNLDVPALAIKWSSFRLGVAQQRPFLVAFAALLLLAPLTATLNERAEIVPARKDFTQFPLEHNGWVGRRASMAPQILETLALSDYIQADYHRGEEMPINLYIAWYASQKKGASIHSPRSCIPGGGWRIESLEQRAIPGVTHANGHPLRVNRALIQKGNVSQVVYYWFEGRNRDVTNEYMAKWYIFWDSLNRSRSDGALVRLVAYVPDPQHLEAADRTLQEYLRDFYPLLPAYTP